MTYRGGAASKKARGLVQLVVGLPKDERDYLKAIAAQGGYSLTEFVRQSALMAACKVIPLSHWKKAREKIQKALDTSD